MAGDLARGGLVCQPFARQESPQRGDDRKWNADKRRSEGMNAEE
jgi:hypothetical protein